jgi:hypothetical protein
MKKAYFPFLLLFVAISAVSCTKSYDCECTDEEYFQYTLRDTKTRLVDVKAKNRKAAETDCKEKSIESIDDEGYGSIKICDLK